jgi:L-amino acid N-acyltransferase YncA
VITFQQEHWPAIRDEVMAIAGEHWETVAVEKDRIKLDLDEELYVKLDELGILHVTTARADGKLAGYYAMCVRVHPHYKQTLFAFLDSYFIVAEHRRGTVGLKLFLAMEVAMKALGVQRMIAGMKLHYDVGAVFERLGWTAIETTFTKYIGEECQ